MKSRLNCLLLKRNFEIKEETLETEECLNENINPVEEDQEDEIWDQISVASDEEITDSESKKKRKTDRIGIWILKCITLNGPQLAIKLILQKREERNARKNTIDLIAQYYISK